MDMQPSRPQALCRAAGAGHVQNVLGVTHIYKALSAETANAFSLHEAIVPPGAGAPPHTHSREDESFYVLSGEVVVDLEGESQPIRVGAGGFVYGPRGRRHAYRNASEREARLLVIATPGAGLEAMFDAIDAAGQAAKGMPPLDKLLAIAAQYGVAIQPPA
ncbi:MAG TPA: cupin domain-containing protein [Stellaceae bacterium]|nr:cupin domain-containing protein [Stellaceae bacterium]